MAKLPRLPAFSLAGSDATTHSAATLRGSPLVLYFYPKDATPGCTQQACDFRDQHDVMKKIGLRVFGVSADPLPSHAKFIAKQHLPFTLLSDPEHTLATALGVWGEKTLYGRTFLGIIRSTFLIDANGSIVREWRKVKVAGHVSEVIAAARECFR